MVPQTPRHNVGGKNGGLDATLCATGVLTRWQVTVCALLLRDRHWELAARVSKLVPFVDVSARHYRTISAQSYTQLQHGLTP
jgi:hypothetical protein